MNIVGIWSSQNIPGDHEISWPFGTLDLDLGNSVTIIDKDSVKLVYEGTIFDRTSEELLNSQTALDNAYGLYSYVLIKKEEKEIIIGTDKLGFSPIYYSMQEDSLVFSTSLTLLKYRIKNPTPDYEAWEEMLNLETVLGEKTTIKEIKRLNYGTRIQISDGKISFIEYWSPAIPEMVDKDNFVKHNNELLFEALEFTRKIQNPKIVLLSGGEDGRRIGVSANKMGLPISFATQETGFLGGYDTDSVIAQKVSEFLKIPIAFSKLPSSANFVNDMFFKNYWLGFETHFHDWIIPLLKNLPTSSLIYDGIAGDVIVNGHWARLFPERYFNDNVDQVAKMFCGESRNFQIDSKKLNSTLFERVRLELNKYPDGPVKIDHFYLTNRARRTISLMAQLFSLMNHKTCCPFLYYPLFMHSLSLDPEDKIDVLYQRSCMTQIHPAITTVPSTRDSLGEEYLINRSNKARNRELLLSMNIRLHSEVKRSFPKLGPYFVAYEIAQKFKVYRILLRMNWRMIPLSRMSEYFDWLGDSNQPSFPIHAEEPEFLKGKFIN